jgi:hypothetical protein
MSDLNFSTVELGLYRVAADNLNKIKALLRGDVNHQVCRLATLRELTDSHVVYDLIITYLTFTDQLVMLFDYQDNGFSSKFRSEIRRINTESYDIAKPVLESLGKVNVMELQNI